MLFAFLLCCNAVSGQTVLSFKDSSVVKIMDDLPAVQPFDTAHSYNKITQSCIYIISDNDVYRTFGYNAGVKYREFNFTDYHIFGEQQCKQCMQYCRHEEGQTNCHRNVCIKEWVWVMRDNKKAFTEIPSTTMRGHLDADIPNGRPSFFGDTIITSKKDTTLSNWYTHGRGDCFARFKYNVFADNYHPVVLLKERNYWGGCRAGGGWTFTVSFRKPWNVVQYRKNIILMEKYKNETNWE